MADRVLNDAADIYAELIGFSGTITADLVNPIGTVILNDAATTNRGDNRYSFGVSANVLNMEGVWVVNWSGSTAGSLRQQVTVGPRVEGMTKWDLRMVIASEENDVLDHRITTYDGGNIVDRALVATTGAYRNRFVILHPTVGVALAGQVRRIRDFSGSAIVLTHPYASDPANGTRYGILRIDPAEIDRAMVTTFVELAPRSRVPVTISGLVSVDGAADDTLSLTIPETFTHVHQVWITSHPDNTKWNGLEIPSINWWMQPNRKLIIGNADLDVGDTFQIAGTRSGYYPQFEDSVVDVAPAAVVHGCVQRLMSPRAGGAGVDIKEHLRRLLIAQQGWDMSLRHSTGRPTAGRREVLR